MPDGYIDVRNFTEFKKLFEETLEKGDKIEAISFDNDLGTGEMEGWEIAKWITETYP